MSNPTERVSLFVSLVILILGFYGTRYNSKWGLSIFFWGAKQKTYVEPPFELLLNSWVKVIMLITLTCSNVRDIFIGYYERVYKLKITKTFKF